MMFIHLKQMKPGIQANSLVLDHYIWLQLRQLSWNNVDKISSECLPTVSAKQLKIVDWTVDKFNPSQEDKAVQFILQ